MITLPPVEFDHPYIGQLVEWVKPISDVDRLCRLAGTVTAPGTTIYGCQFWLGRTCFIYLPSVGIGGSTQALQDLVRRHEHGHCNGWPVSHPL